MSKSLFEIFEDYFYPQINIGGDDINADIERYEACYRLLQDLLFDLDEIARQSENSIRLSECWDDELYEYFIDCMTEYIMNSDRKSDLTDENAKNYIPYEYTHCDRCGERCYLGAYPQAIEDNDGSCLCELCLDEMNTKEKAAEKSPTRVKIRIIRK